MARRKGAKIAKIEHGDTGIVVDLRLQKSTMTFYAEYGARSFSSKDGDEVRKQVLAAIEQDVEIELHSIIEVEVEVPRPSWYEKREKGGFVISVDRFLYTKLGRFRQLEWKRRDTENLILHLEKWTPHAYKGKPEDFAPPLTFEGTHEIIYYLPYSEAVWEGLLRIVKAANDLRSQLSGVLAGEGAIQFLTAISSDKAPSIALLLPSDEVQLALVEGWDPQPPIEKCPHCEGEPVKVAVSDADTWVLCWDCENECQSTELCEAEIAWPFESSIAGARDFERLGFRIEVA